MENDLNNANPLFSTIGFIEHKHTEMNYSGMCNKCCIVPDFLPLPILSLSLSVALSIPRYIAFSLLLLCLFLNLRHVSHRSLFSTIFWVITID